VVHVVFHGAHRLLVSLMHLFDVFRLVGPDGSDGKQSNDADNGGNLFHDEASWMRVETKASG
jgi:hypothetical protein